MEELFVKIDHYDNYEISNLGNVRNIKTGRILKPIINGRGYYKVSLCKSGKQKNFTIHRLVAGAFIINPENKQNIDHCDNNRLNNDICNLRWVTAKENNQNRSISKRNTSGIKGVHFHKPSNKWQARIYIDGIRISLGCFETLEEASQARVKRANEVFGIYTNACEKLSS